MPTYRTPDVYVEEISVFPPSVAEVETAIPAFIGYTEKAAAPAGTDLKLKPTKIYSLKEFEDDYGLPKDDKISVTFTTATGAVVVKEPTVLYLLYYSVKLFFDNGGGQCYIVSTGTYAASGATIQIADLQAGLNAVALEDEPTLIVIPEAVKLLGTGDYSALVTAVLLQCGTLKDRFGIFDLYDGASPLDAAALLMNRGYFGNNNLKYGAAYYPFLRTTMNYFVNDGETNVAVAVDGGTEVDLSKLKAGVPAVAAVPAISAVPAVTGPPPVAAIPAVPAVPAVAAVPQNTAAYNAVKMALKDHFLVLPPSGAVAGVYAATDTNRGVWKAPANVSLADVIEPVIKLDNVRQDDLNVDATTGKSINALRAFAGKGTLVWGARTLAGNDNEWRYISVRRFFNMVEESVKKSTYWAVFESNDANTWVKVRGMIENYLTQKWREGALAGATTKDAFFVRCGLGTTMSAQDILEGRMIVEIGMAVVRPAEFIILRFSHKLQTS
jgi:phage tail sheath protein FI